MRELRQWLLLLRKVIVSLNMESKVVLEENLEEWKHRGRIGAPVGLDGTPVPAQSSETETALPIGSGEWDQGLGLPLCVVCQNVREQVVSYLSLVSISYVRIYDANCSFV